MDLETKVRQLHGRVGGLQRALKQAEKERNARDKALCNLSLALNNFSKDAYPLLKHTCRGADREIRLVDAVLKLLNATENCRLFVVEEKDGQEIWKVI